MSINEILQEIFEFAHKKDKDIYLTMEKENVIKLYYYIDNLEDKEQILYKILGGKYEEKSI